MQCLIINQDFGVMGFSFQLYDGTNHVIEAGRIQSYEELASVVEEYALRGVADKIFIKTGGRGLPPSYSNKFTNFTKNNVEVEIL